jgi:HPt (histidine-containing phosphotransfer) domain-containing protein
LYSNASSSGVRVSDLPILNPKQLNNLRDLGSEAFKELVQELTQLFQSDVPSRLEKLSEALKEQRWKQVASEAHGLKGSASNLGLERFASLASQAERAALDGDIGPLPGLSQALNELFHPSLDALHKEFLS